MAVCMCLFVQIQRPIGTQSWNCFWLARRIQRHSARKSNLSLFPEDNLLPLCEYLIPNQPSLKVFDVSVVRMPYHFGERGER